MGKRYRYVADNEYNRRRYRHHSRRPRARASWWATILVAGGLIGGALAVQIGPEFTSCNIKGNISYYGGERIYHVPGQEYYSATRINLLKGERWFCSETEAQGAGWRRARR
ncbi:sunset domain-containing protein [Mesorhizobium sp. ORM8.1]